MVTYTIKIYYTPEMRKSVKNIATMVENVVAQTNQGYEDSKIPVRVKLQRVQHEGQRGGAGTAKLRSLMWLSETLGKIRRGDE